MGMASFAASNLRHKNFMSGTKEDGYLMVYVRIAFPQVDENLGLRYGTSLELRESRCREDFL